MHDIVGRAWASGFDQDMVQQMPEKQLVQATLDQLDQVFQEGYRHSFTEAAVKDN